MELDVESRLKIVVIAFASVFAAGTIGYTVIEGWSLFDSLYMTVITLGTIGYGEVHPLSHAGRVFTIFLALFGLGVVAYGFTMMTAFVVGGEFTDVMRRRKMDAKIKILKDHYIVCGAGYTGRTIVEELSHTGRSVVVIESDAAKAKALRDHGHLVIEESALSDETLEAAGVRLARGLFATVKTDQDNVFITLAARHLNPTIRIVSELLDANAREMMLRGGADATVSPPHIGGLRMASEMIRPVAVGFLDSMIRDRKSSYRFEEVAIPNGSSFAGQKLSSIRHEPGETPMVVAVKEPKTSSYTINPGADHDLAAGDVLVVLGSKDEVAKFREAVSA